ncbi:MAG: universal stress protein [Alphaproteobacteria bacterium]|nr:universal stress protein [Alphaproteobacteria bacterium]
MSDLRVVLAPVSGLGGDAAVLEAAQVLAQMMPVHIEVLHARPDAREAVPFMGEGASGALVEQVMAVAQRDIGTRAARAKSAFDVWLKSSGIALDATPGVKGATVAWREETGPEDEWVARRGRLADVIIAAKPGAEDAVSASITFEAALLDTKRPVLLAPPGAAARLVGTPALLAWNGSSEAARAIAAAIPLLAKSSKVVIFAAAEKDPAADSSHLKDYLAWHGITAEGPVAGRDDATTGAKLLETAGQIGAGLLVLGAYTRSRMRQLIYGSVTRHVLNNGTLCTFMAH